MIADRLPWIQDRMKQEISVYYGKLSNGVYLVQHEFGRSEDLVKGVLRYQRGLIEPRPRGATSKPTYRKKNIQ